MQGRSTWPSIFQGPLPHSDTQSSPTHAEVHASRQRYLIWLGTTALKVSCLAEKAQLEIGEGRTLQFKGEFGSRVSPEISPKPQYPQTLALLPGEQRWGMDVALAVSHIVLNFGDILELDDLPRHHLIST